MAKHGQWWFSDGLVIDSTGNTPNHSVVNSLQELRASIRPGCWFVHHVHEHHLGIVPFPKSKTAQRHFFSTLFTLLQTLPPRSSTKPPTIDRQREQPEQIKHVFNLSLSWKRICVAKLFFLTILYIYRCTCTTGTVIVIWVLLFSIRSHYDLIIILVQVRVQVQVLSIHNFNISLLVSYFVSTVVPLRASHRPAI